MEHCPKCFGEIEHTMKTIKYVYKENVLYLKQPGHHCLECDESYLSPTDIKITKFDIVNFEREVDNLLTTDELKKIRKKIQLSAEDASILFGGGIRAFHKYETAEETQSKTLDILLRLVELEKITIDDIRKVITT